MKRVTNNLLKGTLGIAALLAAVVITPTTARADRWHDHDRDFRHDRGDHVELDIHDGAVYEHAPVIVDRPAQIWVEPVYQTVCDKVWHEPVMQQQVDRVWVPERREFRDVNRNGRTTRETVVTPAHYEDVCHDVVVAPGHYEDVTRQVLVADGHWEIRVERVAVAPPPVHDGFRFDLHLPVRW